MPPYWLWWSTLIFLLLRLGHYSPVYADDESTTQLSTTTTTKKGPKSADELEVPRCVTNHQCVNNGVCVKDADGFGRCLCPRSCTVHIPIGCKGNHAQCLVMGDDYSRRFNLGAPKCHKSRCVCPPMFDAVTFNKHPMKTFLPVKCDKRELRVLGKAMPSDSVYRGTDVTLYCCINIDPTNHIDANGVTFIQNDTVTREPTKHPFGEVNANAQWPKPKMSEYDQLITPSCWELEIRNAQQSDSGSYSCLVTPSTGYPIVNYTIAFQVKEQHEQHDKRHHLWFKRAKKLSQQTIAEPPRMIQNLSVKVNETGANVTWEIQQGPQLKIDLKLLRRTDLNGKEVWTKENAVAPLSIGGLRPATPYTLFITVRDGQMEPFALSEHFTTADAKPLPPKFMGLRVGYNSGPASAGASLNCEVEWSSPAITNGRIVKYYVRVRGELRRERPDGALVADDFPPAVDKKCANWDEREQAADGINPIEFSHELLFCKYGPLKPNRNYTVTVWAENGAGRSSPVTFPKTCVTHYAQPDQVEKPTTSPGLNHTQFALTFNSRPDETNGPISCSYIAVVPLPANVSLESLPGPQDIVMDTSTKAFSNNAMPPSEKKVFMAYVAESYAVLPHDTLIGDGANAEGMRPCNMLYLSRHRAGDTALRPGMKYTGFLIVRVDKEEPDTMKRKSPSTRPIRAGLDSDGDDDITASSRLMDSVGGRRSSARTQRQLHLSGPVYGFSGYFKPVYLSEESESGGFTTVVKIVAPIVLFLLMAIVVAIAILQRRGMVENWCPPKLSKHSPDRMLLKPVYKPIITEDLPSEYMIRKRDSDFLFQQEFDSLPTFKYECTAGQRKENAGKNRYNDINAFDCTRVKLKKLNHDDYSDYINASNVMGWNNQKRFIAAQAPLEMTIDDFWRMIWEQDSRLIVMVANLSEKNRVQCTKYWPDDAPAWYGDVQVTPVSSTYNAFYCVRTFDIMEANTRVSPPRSDFGGSVESNVGSEYANVPSNRQNGIRAESTPAPVGDGVHAVRRIVQYHFTMWNDYRAPECSTGLLRFLHQLRTLTEFNDYPVVIHCSAGVGRTGTLITIDSMLDQSRAEGKVDVHGFVCGLRKQRNLMVQSLEQYMFIYKALAEWYLFGDTDMDPAGLAEHYRQLMDPTMRDRSSSISGAVNLVIRPDSNAPLNGMEVEFRKLEHTLEPPEKISFALKDENIMKNRFEAAVPYDRNRIVLAPTFGFVDTTYINASEIKGYFYPYIMAQDPVSENTVFDFWRLISERHVSTVVMLSQEEDWSASEKYWPDELHVTMPVERTPHLFHVTLESEDRYALYVVRRMKYQNMSAKEDVHEVTQFCILGWESDEVVPQSAESLVSLIGRVLERQSKSTDSGHILLHCRNGSSQTGVFCCISLLLERLKTEQRIDVFQTVKGLQTQRPMQFTKLEEYQFCYRAVLEYIRSLKQPPSADMSSYHNSSTVPL